MHAAVRQDAPDPFGFPDYLAALAGLPAHAARPLALRLQVPQFGDDRPGLENYLAYLLREASMHAVLHGAMSTVRQLAFDGPGSALLDGRRLAAAMLRLRQHFRFMSDAAGDYEAVLALDRATVRDGGACLLDLRLHGFNRIRFETGAAPAPAGLPGLAEAARRAGFRSVGLGIGYGMPEQDFRSLRRLLDAVAEAAPDRIALRHPPGAAGPDIGLPPGGVAQRMQQLCRDRLDMAGYTALGAGAFARLPGATDNAPIVLPAMLPGTHLIGCGVDAAGAAGALRWRNAPALQDYYACLDRYQVPVSGGGCDPLFWQTRPYLMQVKDFRDADQ